MHIKKLDKIIKKGIELRTKLADEMILKYDYALIGYSPSFDIYLIQKQKEKEKLLSDLDIFSKNKFENPWLISQTKKSLESIDRILSDNEYARIVYEEDRSKFIMPENFIDLSMPDPIEKKTRTIKHLDIDTEKILCLSLSVLPIDFNKLEYKKATETIYYLAYPLLGIEYFEVILPPDELPLRPNGRSLIMPLGSLLSTFFDLIFNNHIKYDNISKESIALLEQIKIILLDIIDNNVAISFDYWYHIFYKSLFSKNLSCAFKSDILAEWHKISFLESDIPTCGGTCFSLGDILSYSLVALLYRSTRNENARTSSFTIRQCKNCGKIFIPLNKASTNYCNRVSPYKTQTGDDITCAQYIHRTRKNCHDMYHKIYNLLEARKAQDAAWDKVYNDFQNMYGEQLAKPSNIGHIKKQYEWLNRAHEELLNMDIENYKKGKRYERSNLRKVQLIRSERRKH